MASSVASAEAGFSLVELAIALAVLGVMLTGLLGPLQQLRTHQRQQDTRAALAAIRQPIIERYQQQACASYSSARLWDDGVIDPVQTRDVLGLAFAATLEAPIAERPQFGVFRM